jgi:photosystem II stability/assembly factor-like uncharacterized protein
VKRHLLAAVLLAAAGSVVGCADSGTNGDTSTDGAAGAGATLGHVHGLGVDPGDGTLYVASHMGVFRQGGDGELARVADRWQDTMAFTVAGPGHFLASGHPDLREDLPPHLGLIESTDAAATWEPVSLQGKADFHALEVSGDQLYGYDSANGTLLVTTDRERWRRIDRTELVDLAADPDEPGRLLGTTPQGQVVEYDTASTVRSPSGEEPDAATLNAPPLVFLDWIEGDQVAGLAPDGTTYLSDDAGRSWQRLTGPPGQAQAFDATPEAWHVATSTGVYRSTDDGRSWNQVAR